MDERLSRHDDAAQTGAAGSGTAHAFDRTVDPVRLREGMRHFASGVWLLTTRDEGMPYGLLATSVASVSLDPPSVLCSVNQAAATHAAIARSGTFCLNLLARAHRPIAEHFASPARKAERFTLGAWETLTTGAPVLADALTSFDCVIAERLSFGTHTIFVGKVVGARSAAGPADPLVHFEGGFRSLSD